MAPFSDTSRHEPAHRIFLVFLRLGLTAFGGPVAHLARFRATFVDRLHWLDAQAYAELVALCQFLPGPSSSQVGLALGGMRGGWRGALAAWCGFTLPSAVLLCLAARVLLQHGALLPEGGLEALQGVALAVVIQATAGMWRAFCPDLPRSGMALCAAALLLVWPGASVQGALMAGMGLLGAGVLSVPAAGAGYPAPRGLPPGWAIAALLAGGLVFALLVLAADIRPGPLTTMARDFYRTGALVFGGGHVVLPLLETAVVRSGQVPAPLFAAGYGLAQAMPGPLFGFSAFLGMIMAGVPGALVGIVAIFAPSFFLLAGILPFWSRLRSRARVRAALGGVNAAVVGMLLAALAGLVQSVAATGVRGGAVALLALAALVAGRLPPWLVVAGVLAAAWVTRS